MSIKVPGRKTYFKKNDCKQLKINGCSLIRISGGCHIAKGYLSESNRITMEICPLPLQHYCHYRNDNFWYCSFRRKIKMLFAEFLYHPHKKKRIDDLWGSFLQNNRYNHFEQTRNWKKRMFGRLCRHIK